MARVFKDGAGASYDGANSVFTTVPYGSVLVDPLNPGAGQQANPTGKFFEIFNFGSTATFKAKADNSVAGEMRDCGECHVGGGMMEYVIDSAKATNGTYSPSLRTSLRNYVFGTAVTAFNALIDIFNPDTSKRGDAIINDFAQTGVLEMDCLMCHGKDYNWETRKEAVRKGEFDASRVVGAGLGTAIDGVTVNYSPAAVKVDPTTKVVSVDLSGKIASSPESSNCASCHQSQYNVDWKKRGEQWLLGSDVHYGLGCMSCHQRKDKLNPVVGTEGVINTKLGLCDPAKGSASQFDALWNKLDDVNFKKCEGCHEPTATDTGFETFGAPLSVQAHTAKGLNAKIAFDKSGNRISHIQLIDCTACHIKKTFDGGAIVDGSGADAEGRVALHDEPQVARDMTNGNALYWDNGKLYAANLLTSSFLRDMNGMDAANNGLDVNNDGRNAGLDVLLQTHINDINIAKGRKALTMEKNADGSWVNETEVGALFTALQGDGLGTATTNTATAVEGGIKQLLGISDATNAQKFLPKMSFLMVPFKASHNIVAVNNTAWGKNGCGDCHGSNKGFYNGSYPIKGNMDGLDDGGVNYKFRFKSNQVTTFTKVNGLVDVTDSHPNVVTKKGDRTVPVPMLTKFDTPYTSNAGAVSNQTLRNIDRSEVIYEATFQARDTSWKTSIVGAAPPAACSGATSPFYCATPTGIPAEDAGKSMATSTKGWLLKIEVRPAGDTNAANITFRTAQLGKDNAASMTEVLAALPTAMKTNADFTITEAPAGALTITAAAGKEIRVSPQTDVGPFGLKGALWIADPIVRGSNSYTGRSTYVTYLDTLSSAAAFGIGVDPVATINTITDIDSSRPGTQVAAGSVTLTAANAQPAGGYSNYLWYYTDGSKDANGNLIRTTIGNTQTVSATFTAGTKVITLEVIDEEGKFATAMTTVEAVAPGIGIAVADGTANVGVVESFNFTNLPTPNNSVKISWGDGMTQTFAGTDVASLTKTHKYASTGTKKITVNVYVNGIDPATGSSIQTLQGSTFKNITVQ